MSLLCWLTSPLRWPGFFVWLCGRRTQTWPPWARGKTFAAAAAGCAASLPFTCSNAQVESRHGSAFRRATNVGRPNYIYIRCCTATAAATD